MFDLVYKYKRALQILLALLIIPPFAFFGIESYFQGGRGGDAVATVGNYKISQQEFTQSLRERQDALRNMAGGRADPDLLDSNELRFSVIDTMVQQRLLTDRAVRAGHVVTEKQIRELVAGVEAFQEGGKFSFARYEELLKSQGMTPPVFEQRVRQDVIGDQAMHAYMASSFVSRSEAANLLRITEQGREVSFYTVAADKYLPRVKLEADAVRKYYDSRPDEFRIPEQVRVEFVVLSAEAQMAQVQVAPAEVRKAYDDNQRRFQIKEARQASHILIAAEGGADAKKKARAKADELHAQLKKNPKDFAALAKQHSQDPGSAAKGGDLGFFERGAMVKGFDDVVFSMKPGEISQPVETEFGWHIIRLAGVRGGKGKTFEEARPEIESEMKRQQAGRKFSELAEGFSNALFEQSDSLKVAADLVKAPAQKSGWVSRSGADNALFGNPKVLRAIFSDDVIKDKRNTEAIEIAPGVLVGARVAEHKPSSLQPFEEVSAALTKKLTAQQAAQLAAQDGRAHLAVLRDGKGAGKEATKEATKGANKEAPISWSNPQQISRSDAKGIPPDVLRQAFRVDVSRLPAYAGVEVPGGYALVRVTKVAEVNEGAKDKQNAIAQTLRQVSSQVELAAYIESLKRKADVKIRKELVEKEKS